MGAYVSPIHGVLINSTAMQHKTVFSTYNIAYYIFQIFPCVPSLYRLIYFTQLVCQRVALRKYSYPCNKPWRPIGLWDVEAPTFSRQSAHRWRRGCQPYAPAGRPLPPGRFLVLISVRGWVDLRAIVRLERFSQPTTLPRTPVALNGNTTNASSSCRFLYFPDNCPTVDVRSSHRWVCRILSTGMWICVVR
jgi:hypothetical protein